MLLKIWLNVDALCLGFRIPKKKKKIKKLKKIENLKHVSNPPSYLTMSWVE